MTSAQSCNLYQQFETAFPADTSAVLLQTADGRVYSYADAQRESARIANYLTTLGSQNG